MWVETFADRLIVGVTLPVAVDRAWTALTQPAWTASWWGGDLQFEARQDSPLRERRTDADGRAIIAEGRIAGWDPPRRLVMEWTGANGPTDTGANAAEFRLEKDGERTWLRLEHRGWERLPERSRAASIQRQAAEWQRRLGTLAMVLGMDSGGIDLGRADLGGMDIVGQSAASSASPPV
jgi:uncharacterized protein YndB with AHSA1/START domain